MKVQVQPPEWAVVKALGPRQAPKCVEWVEAFFDPRCEVEPQWHPFVRALWLRKLEAWAHDLAQAASVENAAIEATTVAATPPADEATDPDGA